jgi:hypothetical protein
LLRISESIVRTSSRRLFFFDSTSRRSPSSSSSESSSTKYLPAHTNSKTEPFRSNV